MDDLDRYVALAHETTIAEFLAQSDALFLVKRPNPRAAQLRGPAMISYETQHTKLEFDPHAAEWRLFPVKKREGNPYPERISIGRATNCDIVIRLPSISKVHAQILLEGTDKYGLRDNDASNFTYLNGRKLEPKSTAALQIGDEVAFGSLELEFADAKRLYEILRTEYRTGRPSGTTHRL